MAKKTPFEFANASEDFNQIEHLLNSACENSNTTMHTKYQNANRPKYQKAGYILILQVYFDTLALAEIKMKV